MNNSNPYDELLIKYLVDDLNAEERTFIEGWIQASEENRKYFEELKGVWALAAVKQTLDQVLDGMDMEDKWNRFQQQMVAQQAKFISLNQQEELGSEEGGEERATRRSVVYRMMTAVAVAASVLLVIGLGWKLFTNKNQETPVAKETKPPKGALLATVRHEVNTSGKPKTLLLQDGSQIILWNGSEISFEQPFANNKRHITLKGKADFKVAKDKTRPFTVYSGNLSTTVLGTEFTVTAFEHAATITVRLYEGKVVVKPVDRVKTKIKKDVYLLPGQELIYNNSLMTASVRSFEKNIARGKEENKVDTFKDDPSVPNNNGSWYMFNKQPVSQVFDQLEELYDVEIIYSKEDVQNMAFIAKYDKSESLENILNDIATLNDLTVTKEGNKYMIKKKE